MSSESRRGVRPIGEGIAFREGGSAGRVLQVAQGARAFLDPIPTPKGGEVSPKRSRFRVAQEGPTSSSNELRRRHSKFGQRPNLAQGDPKKSVQHLRNPPSLIWPGRVANYRLDPFKSWPFKI